MRQRKSSKTGNTRHYAIGYAKPPTASQFKPGQSGNAKGRPKGRKNFKTLIRNAMTAKISIQENGRNKQVSKLEGVVLRQLQSALQGDDKSAMAVMKIATQLNLLDDVADNGPVEAALSASDERILQVLASRGRGVKGR
jgi:hypothetical protein